MWAGALFRCASPPSPQDGPPACDLRAPLALALRCCQLGQYRTYLHYIAKLAAAVGFAVDEENLRIPSTKCAAYPRKCVPFFEKRMPLPEKMRTRIREMHALTRENAYPYEESLRIPSTECGIESNRSIDAPTIATPRHAVQTGRAH